MFHSKIKKHLPKINILKKHFNTKLSDNTYKKIFSLILIPSVVALLLFSIIFISSYANNRKALLKESYSYRLDLIYRNNEQNINSIIQTVHMFSSNKAFMKVALGESFPSESDIAYTKNIFEELVQRNGIIQSAELIDRQNKLVITDTYSTDINSFFYDKYVYREYDESFWKYYQAPLSTVRALSPTFVDRHSEEKETLGIIPIVFTSIGNTKISNLIVLNISIPNIIDNEEYQLTKNSQFFIINRQTRQKFGKTNESSDLIDDNFYNELSKNTYLFFDQKIKGSPKELVIAYSPSNNMMGYTYAVSVPYKDIDRFIYLYILLMILALALLITILAFLSYRSAQKIYVPINEIANMFQSDDSKYENIIDFIHQSVTETLNTNSILSQKVALTLPSYQEKLLVDFLNANKHYQAANIETIQKALNFKHPYFCSIIIKLIPTESFYETYTSTEYNNIQAGIYTIIEYMFSQKYDVYAVPTDTDVLYVLLNIETDNETETILNITQEFNELLKEDSTMLRLSVGIGSILEGLNGLRNSHDEAVRSISSVSNIRHIALNLDENLTKNENPFLFSFNDEETLRNLIITGKKEHAIEWVNEIFDKNTAINESNKIQLDIQIINTLFKVMRLKSIPYDEEEKGDLAIISEIVSMPQYKIQDIIYDLIDTITSSTYSSSKFDAQSMVDYIDQHYTQDISLEMLAGAAGISSKHASKVFKEKFGVNYVDYLAGVRINKAKQYLDTTSKSISEILVLTGFNNRNTFLRTFKKITGLSPTEYKKLNKHEES